MGRELLFVTAACQCRVTGIQQPGSPDFGRFIVLRLRYNSKVGPRVKTTAVIFENRE
jgi:hypothetical protein